MYNLLNKTTDIPARKISWTKRYKFEEDEWGKIFSYQFKNTKDSTVQWFQSRNNHTIIATKTLLYKIKLMEIQNVHFATKQRKLLNIFYGNANVSNDF